ncbi:MAG: CPBP family intramembrane glutamic endopeptidase [candidate division FCPU426 bacterium]
MPSRMKSALWYLALTFILSWSLVGVAFYGLKLHLNQGAGLAVAVLYMFMPLCAVVLVRKFILRQPVREALGLSFKLNAWWLVAWLLPLVLSVGALFASLLVPGVEWSWSMEGMIQRFGSQLTPAQIEAMRQQTAALPLHPLWLGMIQGLLAGVTVNAVAGFGEEAGWRGLLQRDLQFLGFWRSSIFIGLVWGIWHVPIILLGHNYPQHPREGAFYMAYFTILMAPLFAYIRARTRSVVAAAVMHGTLNAVAGISFMTLAGGSDLSVGLTGLAGLAVLAGANGLLWVYDRWLSKDPLIPNYRTWVF